jgi:hypothetical protein
MPQPYLKPVTWEYLAGYFDGVGSLSTHHSNGKGWSYRFRISSHNLHLLEEIRTLLGTGSVSLDRSKRTPYYRFEVGGLAQTNRILARLLPHLQAKRVLVEQWLRDYS